MNRYEILIKKPVNNLLKRFFNFLSGRGNSIGRIKIIGRIPNNTGRVHWSDKRVYISGKYFESNMDEIWFEVEKVYQTRWDCCTA